MHAVFSDDRCPQQNSACNANNIDHSNIIGAPPIRTACWYVCTLLIQCMYIRTVHMHACMHALRVSEGVSVSSQEGAAGSRWCPSPREDWNTAPGACFPSLTGAAPLPSRSAGAKQRQTHTNCQTTIHDSAPCPGRDLPGACSKHSTM